MSQADTEQGVSVSIADTADRGNNAGADWRAGDRLLGLYEVVGELGAGGMGKVYQVHHLGWGLDLAVKCPHADIFEDAEGQASFIREAEVWVGLGLHPHIVSCYYVRTIGDVPRVFAEYVEGGSLLDWILDGRLYEGAPEVAISRMLDFAIQFAWGLDYAHQRGVVHQDVKPHNVMISRDGVAKVTDFGLAQALAQARHGFFATGNDPNENQGLAPCTAEYASPEQLAGAPVGFASDVWSWGISVLEMFSASRPGLGAMAPTALQEYIELGPCDEIPPMPAALVALLQDCFQADVKLRPGGFPPLVERLLEIYRQETGREYSRPAPQQVVQLTDDLNNRAASLVDLERYQEAEALLAEALRHDAWHLYASYNHALLRWRQALISDLDVLARLHELQTLHGAGWQLPFLTAWIHAERGEASAARRLFADATRRAGADEGVQHQIELALGAIGEGWQVAAVLKGHEDFVYGVATAPSLIASGGADRTVRLWSTGDGRCLRALRTRTAVRSISLSESWIAACGEDDTLMLADVASGRIAATLSGPMHWQECVAMTPDGWIVLAGGVDGVMQVWDMRQRTCLYQLAVHAPVHAAAILADGTCAISGDEMGRIVFWDLSTGGVMHGVEAHEGAVRGLAIAGDGSVLVSCGDDGALRIWSLPAATLLRSTTAHRGAAMACSVDAIGYRAASIGADNTIRIYDVKRGTCVRTLETDARVNAVAQTEDCRRVVVGGANGFVTLWQSPHSSARAPMMIVRPRASEEMLSTQQAYEAAMKMAWDALRAERWQEALEAACEARELPGFARMPEALYLWGALAEHSQRGNLREVWPLHTLKAHNGWVVAFGMSADGRRAATAGEDGQLLYWDLEQGQLLRSVPVDEPVRALALADDGCHAVTVHQSGRVICWNLAEENASAPLCDNVQDVALTPDGRFILTAGLNQSVKLWEAATGEVLREFQGKAVKVALSPDGSIALLAANNGTLRCWEVASGYSYVMTGHEGAIRGIAIASACKVVTTAGEDQTLRVWQLGAPRGERSIVAHNRGVWATALSADGKIALSGGKDKMLKVWDLQTGANLGTLVGHTDWVTGVGVSADGRLVASCGKDGQLRVWYLDWNLLVREVGEAAHGRG
ncbi:MAG: WD40 repeat domain-containing serine/threonine protein kinase [Candidatus Xenobia bacterium]